MYCINSKVDKPDIDYLLSTVSKSMETGIEIKDIGVLITKLSRAMEYFAEVLRDEYKIQNPNSQKQLTAYLSSIACLDIAEVCMVDGKWKTDKEAMARLDSMGYPIGGVMLKYRRAKKYLDSLRTFRDAVDPKDGRVHPSVSLTKTNRISYSNPALMNIPKQLLWNLIRPKEEGNILLSVDIKNQEPTILLNRLNIQELKPALVYDPSNPKCGLYERLFERTFRPATMVNIFVSKDATQCKEISEIDMEARQRLKIPECHFGVIKPSVFSTFHSPSGERIALIKQVNLEIPVGFSGQIPFPKEIRVKLENGRVLDIGLIPPSISVEDTKKETVLEFYGYLEDSHVECVGIERKEFKTAWNAMTYGAGIRTIKSMCRHIDGERFYRYFTTISEFKNYKSLCSKAARNRLFVVNTLFGSKLNAGDGNQRQMERVLMDLPIQGTASDILALLLKHFHEEVEKRGISEWVSFYYSRHDELILEVDRDFYNNQGGDSVIGIVRDILEHKIDDWEPFRLDIKQVEPVAVEEIISYFNEGED